MRPPPAQCPHTVGTCPVMRTCENCGHTFGSRSAKESHRLRVCRHRWPLMIHLLAQQEAHWVANHTHYHEQQRNRHNLVTERRAR